MLETVWKHKAAVAQSFGRGGVSGDGCCTTWDGPDMGGGRGLDVLYVCFSGAAVAMLWVNKLPAGRCVLLAVGHCIGEATVGLNGVA